MQMQISSAPLLTAAKLAELVALGHNRISQIYLHWTAGRYGQLYDDYHFNIDADGSIYQTCTQLPSLKAIRGTAIPALSVSLSAAPAARCPITAEILSSASFRPLPARSMPQVISCQAGAGAQYPYRPLERAYSLRSRAYRRLRTVQRRRRNPLGLMVSARFTRRRSYEARRAGHQGQGPVVCKKQPP